MRRLRLDYPLSNVVFLSPARFRITLHTDDREAIIETDEYGLACFARRAHEALKSAESSYRHRIDSARKSLRGEA